MFGFAMRWALRLAGPALAVAAPYMPAASTLKAIGRGIVIATVLGFGACAGWVLHSWGEPERLERARTEAVEKASLRNKVETQRQAIDQQTQTLQFREQQLDASEQQLDQLKKQMEAIRAQSQDPGRAVLPADDPWMLAKRAGGGAPARRVD
jgi:uncharacterized protein HemX